MGSEPEPETANNSTNNSRINKNHSEECSDVYFAGISDRIWRTA